ncbi:speckle-type POZ protein-like [Fopius arisanus]|uniref:Speckle-type POZ protein-like n=1 Tax=Fopius arisanus TaxID=64838 RepID=A0A9R1U2A6_9HYME|nr:PREDICTED: speckle-type POZ protein-like [Fopius arisanus]XP_011304561.1 PREDICTED: speckle-type POZ protein-like [Fopius arisanus]
MSAPDSEFILIQRTRDEVFTYHHEWKIKNFSGRPEAPGQCIKSSMFSLTRDPDKKWYIRLYPKGTHQDEPNFMSLRVCLKAEDPVEEVPMKVEVSVLTVHQVKKFPITWVHKYLTGRPYGPSKSFHRNWLQSSPDVYLPGDILTLLCQFTVLEPPNSVYDRPKFKQVERRLGQDLEIFLSEGSWFSDISFDFSGEIIPAHRSILAARSSVFAAMFKYSGDVVPIVDIQPDVFKAMLTYIYTDSVPRIKDMAGQLLEVAERFGLDGLKAMCEPIIFEKITFDNCAEVLVTADLVGATQLKTSVIEFITRNLKDVVKTQGYRCLEQMHAALLTEIILEMEPKTKKPKQET